eukprot:CAMPEP_0178985846 /NCGR_PEP_ID=MMETSP0795-20121207/2375_1 /TAXON_ID=88552 /ORGANISM="Amoebophrya sp., Strain Ameob2" /LENGTH=925 /DNA_ID=CAMNT_0020676841 /DNA_START=299 /DNA_END=3076 /DNA_ORIENTATION=+
MTVLGVQVQRRSGYDLMNNSEFVSIVRVSTSLTEPIFPPVNMGLGAYGSRLRPGGTLTASQQTAAERVAESQKGINGMLASGGAASASASASATAAGAQQASATATASAVTTQAQPSTAFLENPGDGGGRKVAPDRGESRRSDNEFQLSRILNETAAASFLEESEKRDVKIHDVIYDGTTLQAAPYQKGGMETTLFWIGYDIDARGWADVRLRDSVLARYVKVTAVECKNHCSMRARVRVLSRAGCFTESFYMVSGPAFREKLQNKKNAKMHALIHYKVKHFVKDNLMGVNPHTGEQWPRLNATSAVDCQRRCAETAGCEYFTFFEGDARYTLPQNAKMPDGMRAENLCYLQNRDAVPLPLAGRHWSHFMKGLEGLTHLGGGRARTGTKFCRSGRPGMHVQVSNLHKRVVLFSPTQCQKLCADTPECEYFSFWADGGCHLFRKHARKVHSMYTAMPVWSAPKYCDGNAIPASHTKAVCNLPRGASSAGSPAAATAAASSLLETAAASQKNLIARTTQKKSEEGCDQQSPKTTHQQSPKKNAGELNFCFVTGKRYTGGRQLNSFGTMDDGLGYCLGNSIVDRLYVATARECQLRCASTPSCYYFTHRTLLPGYCHLQTYDAVLATGTNSVNWAGGTVTSGGRICREELTQLQRGEDPFTKVATVERAPENCADGTFGKMGEFLVATWRVAVVCDDTISGYRHEFYSESDKKCKNNKARRLKKCKELCLLSETCELLWHDKDVRNCHGYRKCENVETSESASPETGSAGTLLRLNTITASYLDKLPPVPPACAQEQPPPIMSPTPLPIDVTPTPSTIAGPEPSFPSPTQGAEEIPAPTPMDTNEPDSSCKFHLCEGSAQEEKEETAPATPAVPETAIFQQAPVWSKELAAEGSATAIAQGDPAAVDEGAGAAAFLEAREGAADALIV